MKIQYALAGVLLATAFDLRSDEGNPPLSWLRQSSEDRPTFAYAKRNKYSDPWPTIPTEDRIAVAKIEQLIREKDPEVLAETYSYSGCRYYAMRVESGSGMVHSDIVLYAAGEIESVARRQSLVTVPYSVSMLVFEGKRLRALSTFPEDQSRSIAFPLRGCASP